MYDRAEALPVWRLKFADHPGLTVRVTVPTAEARAVAPKLVPLLASGRDDEIADAMAKLGRLMADSLLSWTLAWNGRPVPATRAGVLRIDSALLGEILTEWTRLWAAPTETAEPASDIDAQLAGLSMTPLVPGNDDADDDAAPNLPSGEQPNLAAVG